MALTQYLGNAFSLSMLDVSETVSLTVQRADDPKAVIKDGFVSCVGHPDTARIFSDMLGVTVEPRRVSVKLAHGDSILVGQYIGPRLPEGATSLPEGARIEWLLVTLG